MGATDWRLAAMAMTLLALAFTGALLVRSIWLGRPVSVKRYRSVLMVQLAAGVLFSLPVDRADDPVVVAGTLETAPCLGTTGVSAFQPHGERLTITGVGRPGPACGIWAAIEDASTGGVWLQGPATVRETGWDLELVMGAGDGTADALRYAVNLIAVDSAVQNAWLTEALAGQPIRLQSPPAASHVTQRRFELRRSGDVIGLAELPSPR